MLTVITTQFSLVSVQQEISSHLQLYLSNRNSQRTGCVKFKRSIDCELSELLTNSKITQSRTKQRKHTTAWEVSEPSKN